MMQTRTPSSTAMSTAAEAVHKQQSQFYVHEDSFIHTSVLHLTHATHKGRCLLATQDIAPGTMLIAEAPFACIAKADSTLPSLSLRYGKYALNAFEQNMLQFLHMTNNLQGGYTPMLAARCLISLIENPVVKPWYDGLFYHHPRPAGVLGGGNKSSSDENQPPPDTTASTTHHTSSTEHIDESVLAMAEIVKRLIDVSRPDLSTKILFHHCVVVLLKLTCNAFTIENDELDPCANALYLFTACINHSCQPNCLQRFDADGKIVIRSIRPIFAGEEITISYIDTARPTWWRQIELLHYYYFQCTCMKCTNVEMYEGFRCKTRHCQGLLRLKTCCNTKYQFRLWLAGRYPPALHRHEGDNSNKKQRQKAPLLKQLALAIPFGDLCAAFLWPSSEAIATSAAANGGGAATALVGASSALTNGHSTSTATSSPSFYCSTCQQSQSLDQLVPSIRKFLDLAKEVDNMDVLSIATIEEARKALRQLTFLMLSCDEIIPVHHYSHQYCTGKLAQAYLTLIHLQSNEQQVVNRGMTTLDMCMLHQKWMETMVLDMQERIQLYDTIHPVTITALFFFLRHNLQLLNHVIVCIIGKETSLTHSLREYCLVVMKWCRQLIAHQDPLAKDISRCYGKDHTFYVEFEQHISQLYMTEEMFHRLLRH